MASRLAGRLLTSPLAFLLAGVVDFVLFAVLGLRYGARVLLRRRRRRVVSCGRLPRALLRRRESAS